MSRLLMGAAARQRSSIGGASAAATLYLGRVTASSDDAEETEAGRIFLTSSDLELGTDDAEGNTVIGLRFTDIGIARGAPVNEAYVQFTAHSFGSGAATLFIRAQAADDASTFLDVESDLREREATETYVTWTPPEWATNQASGATTTPNIASVISEVTSRPGWQSGNAIVLLIGAASTSAARAAHSYDSDPAKAPQLFINQAPLPSGDDIIIPPASSPSTSTGVWTLEGDTEFSTTSPVLANGFALTGEALDLWNGVMWLMSDHENRAYVSAGGANPSNLALRDDLYHYARPLAEFYGALQLGLRLTRWLGFLDEWVRLAKLQASTLAVGYRAGYNADAVRWPTHTYRSWVWRYLVSEDEYWGTDYHPLDNIRTHAPLWALLYALKLNSGKVSPAGHNYAAEAAFWETYLTDWLHVWSGPEARIGRSKTGASASGWSANYRGNLNRYYRNDSSIGPRPAFGTFPVQSRQSTHTHIGASAAHYWLGKAMPEYASATTIGAHGWNELFQARNVPYYTGTYGRQALLPRGLSFIGHNNDGENPYLDPAYYLNYMMPMTYVSMVPMDGLNMWLEGGTPTIVEDFLTPLTRTLNQYAWGSLTASEGMPEDLTNGVAILTGRNAKDQLLPMATAGQAKFSTAHRSNANLVSSFVPALMAFDTDDNVLRDHVYDRMESSSSFRGTTAIAQPKVLVPALARIMKLAGAKDWTP